ncbi:sugar kinase [Pseudovibrio exalbescens]|uniref:sugar kinase n=1 Tax=Pseudovibrio exalbescens TaxID=197461 RepID=UPI002365EF83|nr:sugar kinase [Pseudovibrio exalbescens]MDD7908879.1 sugar kinase [Pseudovibrio exalbescens]
MEALFIGQAYIDITFLTKALPTGDEKTLAEDYAVSFGGNAVTAAFACAKLGLAPDLMCTVAEDWLAHMFRDMASKYRIHLHSRKVNESSLSFIMPQGGHRAIVRCRDNDFLHPYPELSLEGCRALHVDGHMPDAALHYAQACRKKGILTSMDGGAFREDTDEILEFIDVAIVSELFCEQIGKSYDATLDYLRSKRVKVGGVTLGEYGMLWFEGDGETRHLPALSIPPSKTIDTNGAGDTFHGAYIYSYLTNPTEQWETHFRFARTASAYSIQYLGNEASLPTLRDVEDTEASFTISLLEPKRDGSP